MIVIFDCITTFLANSNSILQIFHAKTSINNKVYYLGASTIILSKDIDKYAFLCGLIFYETDVTLLSAVETATVAYNGVTRL